jgi:hypothetical protein
VWLKEKLGKGKSYGMAFGNSIYGVHYGWLIEHIFLLSFFGIEVDTQGLTYAK